MSDLFGDLDGVEIIVDDILVHGTNPEEHDCQVRHLLERACRVGLKLNPKKSHIGLAEVEDVGHTISRNGLKPNQERVKAVTNMPTPMDKECVQRFIALIGYL